jgi:hypothetical protein
MIIHKKPPIWGVGGWKMRGKELILPGNSIYTNIILF